MKFPAKFDSPSLSRPGFSVEELKSEVLWIARDRGHSRPILGRTFLVSVCLPDVVAAFARMHCDWYLIGKAAWARYERAD